MDDNLRLTLHPVPAKNLIFRRTVTIKVDNRPVEAFEGESLAAALWAKGIFALRHDEKTGASRGMYCGIGHCYECRVKVDGEEGVRSCMTIVREGMRISLCSEAPREEKNR